MAKGENKYQINMTEGSLAGKILLFALPLMLSSLLQLLFNAADIVVVGRFSGKEALAAVGSTSSLINLLINLFMGLSVGANVVLARDLGSGRQEDVRRSVHTTISLSLASGVILAVVGAVFCRQFLLWMSSPADVIELSTLYLRIYFLGMPANMFFNFGAAILRSQGDTRRPLYYLTAAGVINVLLNLLFVISFQMGVAGVALATIISQYISAILVLLCLMRDNGPLHLDLKQLCLDLQIIRRILQVGLPAGFQSVIFAISNVVIQSAVNSFDSTIMAGSSTAANIEGFVYVSMNAFYQTAITFASQNYGACQCRRVDRTALFCLGYSTAFGLVLGIATVIFGRPLAAIYAPGEEAVIAAAVERLCMISAPYFLCGLMDVMSGVLRGIGFSVFPTVGTLVGACGLRLVWIATIFQVYHTPRMLYLSYPVSWAITALVHITFFLCNRKKAYAKVSGQPLSY